MKNNPDTAEMDAVKNDRFIVLSGLAMFPSLENTDVVEQIANAVPLHAGRHTEKSVCSRE